MPVVKDEKALKEAQDLRRSARLRELRDIRAVMGTEEGRRFVWRMLAESRVFLSASDPNPHMAYQKMGRQAIGRIIFNDVMESCRELFWQAQEENIPKENHNV